MLKLFTETQEKQIEQYVIEFEEKVKDGEDIYELQDERRLEGTELEVIACSIIIMNDKTKTEQIKTEISNSLNEVHNSISDIDTTFINITEKSINSDIWLPGNKETSINAIHSLLQSIQSEIRILSKEYN